MMNALRNAAGTWLAKGLLVLLVASFAVWGVSGQITGTLGGDAVVSAGSTDVSVIDYRLAYDRQLRVLSQQLGQNLTREQAQLFGVDQQVLAQVTAGALLDEMAGQIGLGLSKDRLAALTAEDPAFHGPGGGFDRATFDAVLRNSGMRPEDYFKNREQVAIRQQIVEALSDGMDMPDTFLKALALYQGESRTVDYVTIPRSLVEPVADPSEDVLASWFAENKSTYAAPEYRKFSYVILNPEAIADPAAVTPEQVRQDYEARKNRYTEPETRTVEQLVFATPQAAEEAVTKHRAGATFDELVVSEGKTLSDVTLGTIERDDIADAVVADAAFGLELNSVSDVVNGAFGPVLLRVTEINPESTKSLAEVSDEIRQELAIVDAERVLLDVYDAYEDARAGGSTMAEAARAQNIEMVTIEAVDRVGQTPEGTVLSDLPVSQQLLESIFESDVGLDNAPLTFGRSGYVWYEVDAVIAARDRTLDEVRNRAIADWKRQQADRLLLERAAELEKRVTDGATIEEVASELGLGQLTKRGLLRGSEDADLGSNGVAAAFATAQGAVGIVGGPADDSQILFRVTEVVEPLGAGAEAIPEAERDRLAGTMADDFLDQLVARLQGEYEIRVNRAAMQHALSF